MEEKQNNLNRRNFLKTIGAAGVGSVFASAKSTADEKDSNSPAEKTPVFPQVPKRPLGKTGVQVPCLSMGGTVNLLENQIMLRKSLEWGINLWDTSDSYEGGNSELGIGKYLEKNPDARKDLFIVTKVYGAKTIEDVEIHLQTSRRKMNTSYVDLYYIMERSKTEHGLSDPSQLDDELKRWVDFTKRRKMIRFFGFSTHKNMPQCLNAAAKLGWIDALMTTYNFRIMQDAEMNDAVQACYDAGVGIIAMKTQARGQTIETEEDKKLTDHFLKRGFTEGQAKIKVVLEDKRISSVCSRMADIATLTQNVAAVLDKTELTRSDMEALKEYARTTCSGYCAGCGQICDAMLPQTPYVSNIMRYLMYYNNYNQKDMARQLFSQIPESVRAKLLTTDYTTAEANCPQHMPIKKLVAEAVARLA